MRIRYLVGAVSLALWGSALSAAEPVVPPGVPAAAAVPAPLATPPAPAAMPTPVLPPEALRAMKPEERRAAIKEEHEKLRAQAEAMAPPMPPMPPGGPEVAPPQPPEQRAAEVAKLRAMTPPERREAMQEAHAKMREQAEAAMPTPPGMAPPPALSGNGPKTAEEHKAEIEKMRQMTPEERQAQRNQRYQELRDRAASLGLDLPAVPPWEEQRANKAEMMERQAKLRQMTAEQREAYRNEHYKQLRERAKAAGVELPETPPWQESGAFMPPRPSSAEEIERLQGQITKLQQELRAEMEKMREKMRSMAPEDRQAIMEMYRPRLQQLWDQMAEARAPMPSMPPFAGQEGPPMAQPYGPTYPPRYPEPNHGPVNPGPGYGGYGPANPGPGGYGYGPGNQMPGYGYGPRY